jgi:hypothetical protein
MRLGFLLSFLGNGDPIATRLPLDLDLKGRWRMVREKCKYLVDSGVKRGKVV